MAREKKDANAEVNLEDNAPKKGFFGKLFNKHGELKKVMATVKSKNVKSFLFYTDVDNVLQILEYGIRNINSQKLKSNESYTVWTYLEHESSIGLEMDTSTRAHFWKWASDNRVDVNMVAVIGINPEKLAQLATKDWAKDEATNVVYVYDNIPPASIDWIMIKDKQHLKQIQAYVYANDIPIDVYFGAEGNLSKVEKGS